MAGKRFRKVFFIISIGFLVIVSIIYLGVYLTLSQIIKSHFEFDPQTRVNMERFFDNPVDIPPEWLEPPSYSVALLAASERIKRAIANLKLETIDLHRFGGTPFKESLAQLDRGQLHKELQMATPYLDRLIELGKVPDYEISLWDTIAPGDQPGEIDYKFLRNSVSLLSTLALDQAKSNQWEAAFETNLAVYRLAKRHPASTIIVHLIAIVFTDEAMECTANLIEKCENPQPIRAFLTELNQLESKINPNVFKQIYTLAVVSELRKSAGENPLAGLTPHDLGITYFRKNIDAKLKQNMKMIWGGNSSNDLFQLSMYRMGRIMGMGHKSDELMFAITMPNFINTDKRELVAVSHFHLARLSAASKLFFCEYNTYPENVSALVPEFLPEEPLDPFADKDTDRSYRYDAAHQTFYSLGPDGADDFNTIPYDSSNGIVSQGDISFVRH